MTMVVDLFQTKDSAAVWHAPQPAELAERPCTFFSGSLTTLLSSPSRVRIGSLLALQWMTFEQGEEWGREMPCCRV